MPVDVDYGTESWGRILRGALLSRFRVTDVTHRLAQQEASPISVLLNLCGEPALGVLLQHALSGICHCV
jgi:hypothetical protein